MCDLFRTLRLAASIAFLLSPLAPNHCFGAGRVQSIGFVRALDPYHSGERRPREGSTDGEASERKENGFFETASTLEDVWSTLKALVPNRGSNGYIEPEATVLADFERIVLDMMMIGHEGFRGESKGDNHHGLENDCVAGVSSHLPLRNPSTSCDTIDLHSLKGKYRIGTFVDGDNGRTYCVLATTSISHPWGNVIVDLDASSATKNLSFDCPHPKFDAETGEQGIRLLKGTTSRSWVVSGSHRMANNRTLGICQPEHSHYPSDVAHSVDNCFLSAIAAIKFYYESVVRQDYTSVQLHGMSQTTCGSIDTFFSHGSCSETFTNDQNRYESESIPPRAENIEKIDILREIAEKHPFDNGKHAVTGRNGGSNGGCHLCGSTNIQGRLINDVARENLCDTVAASHSGRFIQIEQKREYRRESRASFWNDVFNEAYPLFLSSSRTEASNGAQAHRVVVTDDSDGQNSSNDHGVCVSKEACHSVSSRASR